MSASGRLLRIAALVVLAGCLVVVFPTVLRMWRGGAIDANGSVGVTANSPVESAIESATDGSILDLAKMTGFQWDRLWLFPPYTTNEQVEKDLGFAWGGASESNIHESDGIVLFVFVKDHRVVHAFEQPRMTDFSSVTREKSFSPGEARFVKSRSADGRRAVGLAPAPSTRPSTLPSKQE